MNKITMLDGDTIKRIAAGEVVTRPANVVKELVENSIDAGATKIIIEIRNAGKSYIKVEDDGEGIPRDELLTAFQLHTTSKIHDFSDLEHLQSMGFRGEALASIAAVSIIECTSRYRDDPVGGYVLLEAGKVIEEKDVNRVSGTTMIVKDLFFNIPARKKFLKTNYTEKSHINDVVIKLALAHPQIAFTFIDDGRNVLTTPQRKNMLERLFDVFGGKVGMQFIALEGEKGISGVIVKPQYARRDKAMQYFFVNQRPVQSNLLSNILQAAYGTTLMTRQYPACVINIEIDPSEIDVNVHPAKTEIRFRNEDDITHRLFTVVRETLIKKNQFRIVKQADLEKAARTSRKAGSAKSNSSILEESLQNDLQRENVFSIEEERNIAEGQRSTKEHEPSRLSMQTSLIDEKPMKQEIQLRSLQGEITLIGQVFKKYFIATLDQELILFDQHASHERVLYERIFDDFKNGGIKKQKLLEPMHIKIPSVLHTVIMDALEYFNTIGFECTFKEGSLELFTVPSIMKKTDPDYLSRFILEVLTWLNKHDDYLLTRLSPFEAVVHVVSATIACHTAIRAGDDVTPTQMSNVIKDLMKCKEPFNCPHGRPILIRILEQRLDRMFKRIV